MFVYGLPESDVDLILSVSYCPLFLNVLLYSTTENKSNLIIERKSISRCFSNFPRVCLGDVKEFYTLDTRGLSNHLQLVTTCGYVYKVETLAEKTTTRFTHTRIIANAHF